MQQTNLAAQVTPAVLIVKTDAWVGGNAELGIPKTCSNAETKT